jgi:predicted ATPase/class 3 adenylate cyclase/Tfp pilus assembly protein PilF
MGGLAGSGALDQFTVDMDARTLLITDIVDSTLLNGRHGDSVMATVWSAHDKAARALVRRWGGREIARSDGLLLVFDATSHAVGFAGDYQRAVAELPIHLQARVAIHIGYLAIRENDAGDRELGAPPIELDGIALPTAARIAGMALGGQILLSAAARQALAATPPGRLLTSRGFWHLKGVEEPIELFELSEHADALLPLEDSEKAYCVVRSGERWLPRREVENNLPAERNSFIGRAEELRQLADSLRGGTRLISLLGMGGIGKTRLALRYGVTCLGEYPGGVWMCDLSQASSLEGVANAVALAIGVPVAGVEVVSRIGSAIAGRGRCLLILDNFEQAVRHAERSVGSWMERASEARFLVTTRELLGIQGEVVQAVPPLGSNEAAILFRDRATALTVGPMRDDGSIEDLVELLDRLPLAIELAAARARTLSPRVMTLRMNERFRLLSSHGGRLDRQATLRATLDWSWELLSQSEQRTLANLAVFAGGFTMEAAEAVLLVQDNEWVPDLIQSLVDKSLVRRDNDQRFDLLGAVLDYAAERLASMAGPDGQSGSFSEVVMRKHWEYFSGLGERAVTRNRCIDVHNLVAACRRSTGVDTDHAVSALLGAWAALKLTGPFRVAVELADGLEREANLSAAQQAPVNRVLGSAYTLLGEVDSGSRHYDLARRHYESVGDAGMQAQILCFIGESELDRGRTREAAPLLEVALALARCPGNVESLIRVLNACGSLSMSHSQFELSKSQYDEAMSLAKSLNDDRWQGGIHGNLGVIAQAQGQLQVAKDHYVRALSMMAEIGDRQWEGNTRCNLGLLLHELRDDLAARSELESADRIARSIGHKRLEAFTSCNLGIVLESLEDIPGAVLAYERAIAATQELANPRLEGQFRGYLGLAFAQAARHSEAIACMERAIELLTESDDAGGIGLLHCQCAVATALGGDPELSRDHLRRAENHLADIHMEPDSELGHALERARRCATQVSTPPEMHG